MKALGKACVFAATMVAASVLAQYLEPRVFLADMSPPGQAPRGKLAQWVPTQLGEWLVDDTVMPLPPSPDLQRVIDQTYDETLSRTYRHRDGRQVMLSLAYGRNQHKGMNTHQPAICYPAQGFKLVGALQAAQLPWAGKNIPVQRLVAERGARHEPITYWLLVGEHITPFGYAQRLVTVRYGLRGQVPDGVLVRVSSINQNDAQAFADHHDFLQALLNAVPAAQRARLLGALA